MSVSREKDRSRVLTPEPEPVARATYPLDTGGLHHHAQRLAGSAACGATDERNQQMNKQQLKGKWMQLKGRAQQKWGDLTDDDFDRAEGSLEELAGIIEERTGDRREAVKDELQALADKV